MSHRENYNDGELVVKIKVKERWIPHIVGMFDLMHKLGAMGSSRWIHFFADGDGDFKPEFIYDRAVKSAEPAARLGETGFYFDAG